MIQDAAVYSEHSGKTDIDEDDVRLAIQGRVNYSFTQPPPRDVKTLFLDSIKARVHEYIGSGRSGGREK